VVESPFEATWFADHYQSAPKQIVDFLAGDGIDLAGMAVADLGTGDGLLAAGLYQLAAPRSLVGFDVLQVDLGELRGMLRDNDVSDELPPGLSFEQSTPDHIPAPDDSFDFIVSWSAFEHISDIEAMAREARRVLVPYGGMLIQLYPFYLSEHGDHGWHRPSFEHLLTGVDEPAEGVRLNHVTFDELHERLLAGGMRTAKVELIHHPFHLPAELADRRLSDLAIGGAKLLVTPIA
jgi:SAM-dependent methyltransferase